MRNTAPQPRERKPLQIYNRDGQPVVYERSNARGSQADDSASTTSTPTVASAGPEVKEPPAEGIPAPPLTENKSGPPPPPTTDDVQKQMGALNLNSDQGKSHTPSHQRYEGSGGGRKGGRGGGGHYNYHHSQHQPWQQQRGYGEYGQQQQQGRHYQSNHHQPYGNQGGYAQSDYGSGGQGGYYSSQYYPEGQNTTGPTRQASDGLYSEGSFDQDEGEQEFLVYGADGNVMDADAEDLKNMQECFRQMEEEDYKSFLEEAERGLSPDDHQNIDAYLRSVQP